MNCSSCGTETPASAKFCPECGSRLVRRCSACDAELLPRAKFCAECGARSTAAEPAARSPRAYTPKHLTDRILRSRAALEGERKQVTVLFADVKGSMELAEQLGPEEWHRILERLFAILGDCVHHFEGTVNQYTGDGIMALFGAPLAHEDHAQRACYAALRMRESLREFSRDVKRLHGADVATRIGLNSGEVVVGRIGDDLRMDYTAQGHTVGLAQRMESLAAAGSIYVSERTAALARGYFELEDLGAFNIKGSSEPTQVFELRDAGKLRSRFDVSHSRGLSPFVGRDADMQALESALEQARNGNGQVIGIVADAGTGKSRLCFEFLQACRARGLTTRVGRAQAHGKNIPLVPMLEVFRAYFDIADDDADRLVRDKIAGRLLLMDESFRDLLPVVFEFFGVANPSLPASRISPEAKQRMLFAVLRKIVQEDPPDGQPVTLIEDLHWMDASSAAFLEQWVEAVAGSHALLLLNFRPEYHAPWMNKSWYRQIPLAPLGPEAVGALLENLLGKDPSTRGLAAKIHQQTGGNPFFTEEVVQSLIESGAITGARGAYRLVTDIPRLQVPATVQALLSARIDRLGEREKQVLQAASVIGKDFSEPVLQRVLDATNATSTSSAELQSALQKLKDGEFIFDQSLYPVREYTFKHPLTQEVALHSLLQERRRKTHAAVARALESVRADALDESAALIAHHYEEAADVEAAARWHRRAAERAGMNNVQAAVSHWLRVRELARRMGDGPDASALTLASCAGAISIGGWRVGGSTDMWTTVFEEGCAAAERIGDLNALSVLNMNYGVVRGLATNGLAVEYVNHVAAAMAIIDRMDGSPALRCAALGLLSVAYTWNASVADAERTAKATIAFAGGDPNLGFEVCGFSPLLGARFARAHAVAYQRDPGMALQELRLVYQASVDSGFAENAGWALMEEAMLRCALDQPEGIRALAQSAVRVAENRDAGAIVAAQITNCAALASDRAWQQLLESATEGIEYIRDHNAVHCWGPTLLAYASTAQLELGNPVPAREAATQAVQRIRAGHAWWTPDCYAALARAQLAIGESSVHIAATLDEYEALLTRTRYYLFEGELHELRASLASREGQRQQRLATLQRANECYTRFGMTARAARVKALIDAPAVHS